MNWQLEKGCKPGLYHETAEDRLQKPSVTLRAGWAAMGKRTDGSARLQSQMNNHLNPGTDEEVHSAFNSKVAGEQPLWRIKSKQYLGSDRDGTSRLSSRSIRQSKRSLFFFLFLFFFHGLRNVKQSFGLCRQSLTWDIALFPPRPAIAGIDSDAPIFGKALISKQHEGGGWRGGGGKGRERVNLCGNHDPSHPPMGGNVLHIISEKSSH